MFAIFSLNQSKPWLSLSNNEQIYAIEMLEEYRIANRIEHYYDPICITPKLSCIQFYFTPAQLNSTKSSELVNMLSTLKPELIVGTARLRIMQNLIEPLLNEHYVEVGNDIFVRVFPVTKNTLSGEELEKYLKNYPEGSPIIFLRRNPLSLKEIINPDEVKIVTQSKQLAFQQRVSLHEWKQRLQLEESNFKDSKFVFNKPSTTHYLLARPALILPQESSAYEFAFIPFIPRLKWQNKKPIDFYLSTP